MFVDLDKEEKRVTFNTLNIFRRNAPLNRNLFGNFRHGFRNVMHLVIIRYLEEAKPGRLVSGG